MSQEKLLWGRERIQLGQGATSLSLLNMLRGEIESTPPPIFAEIFLKLHYFDIFIVKIQFFSNYSKNFTFGTITLMLSLNNYEILCKVPTNPKSLRTFLDPCLTPYNLGDMTSAVGGV